MPCRRDTCVFSMQCAGTVRSSASAGCYPRAIAHKRIRTEAGRCRAISTQERWRRGGKMRYTVAGRVPPPGSRKGDPLGLLTGWGQHAPHALVAQLDRASDFESEGREFESLRARQISNDLR